MPTHPSDNHRWFTLKILFAIVTISGLLFIPLRFIVRSRNCMKHSAAVEHVFTVNGWTFDREILWYDASIVISDRRFGDQELIALKPSIEDYDDLIYLDLRGTQVSDVGLESIDFKHFWRLRAIGLSRTRVSPSGAQNLRSAVPRCRVVYEE